MKIPKLLFGTSGIPFTTPSPNTINGIKHVRELGLDAMELAFVRSVNINPELAEKVNNERKKQNVTLTCHGQYFINLSSLEPEKIVASKERILNAVNAANNCGVWSTTFHAGYYMKQSPEIVYDKIKSGMKEVIKLMQDKSIDMWLRPETTGKATQWGHYKEIVDLSEEVEQVLPCFDFAHVHARQQKHNTLEEFREILNYTEKKLGRTALNNMHIHMAGIKYSEKGERRHLELDDSDFNYKDWIKVWKEYKLKGVVISESPNIEFDGLKMKEYWDKLNM